MGHCGLALVGLRVGSILVSLNIYIGTKLTARAILREVTVLVTS